MPVADPLVIAVQVTDVLERFRIRYSIGGSMASAFAGEPRSTLDVDIVAEVTARDVERLIDALAEEFYLAESALRRAIEQRSSVNLIHTASSVKIDLFVAGGTPLDESLLQRRRAVRTGNPVREIFVHSPEDILLQKLRWFRLGDEVSERQWRDVLGIVRVQGRRLDMAYLQDGARALGVADLLDRALTS